MKKFLPLLFALMILFPTVTEAADVPDIKQIAPSLVLVTAIPADENSAGLYEYTCTDDNIHRYLNLYAQLLTGNGLQIIDGRETGDEMIWGLVLPDKDVDLFQFELDTPVHVLIADTDAKITIRTAPGITYGG